jgi:hypothetical protein
MIDHAPHKKKIYRILKMDNSITINEINRKIYPANSNDVFTITSVNNDLMLFLFAKNNKIIIELHDADANIIFQKDFTEETNIANIRITYGSEAFVLKRANQKKYYYIAVDGNTPEDNRRYVFMLLFEIDEENNILRYIKKIRLYDVTNSQYVYYTTSSGKHDIFIKILAYNDRFLTLNIDTEQVRLLQYQNIIDHTYGLPLLHKGSAITYDEKYFILCNQDAIFLYSIETLDNVKIIPSSEIFRTEDLDVPIEDAEINRIRSHHSDNNFYIISGLNDRAYTVKSVYDTVNEKVNLIHNYNYSELISYIKDKYGVDYSNQLDLTTLFYVNSSDDLCSFIFNINLPNEYIDFVVLYSKYSNEYVDLRCYGCSQQNIKQSNVLKYTESLAINNSLINLFIYIDDQNANEENHLLIENRYQLNYNILSSCEKSKVLYNIRNASVFSSNVKYGDPVHRDDLDILSCGNVGSTNIRRKENICKFVLK